MARSLPPKPNLGQLKNQAKDLVKAHRSGDPSTCETLRRLNRFKASADADILAMPLTLADAQFALALDYGFPSWNALKECATQSATMAWAQFAEDARKSIYFAQESAIALGRNQVDFGDYLAGIRKETSSPGAVVLRLVDQVNPIDASEIAFQPDPNYQRKDLQLTARVKSSIDAAYEEAGILRHRFIGSQHLVLGVFRYLAQNGVDIPSAEARLTFAREIVRRQPSDAEQKRNAVEFERRLDEAGGDPQVLIFRQVVGMIRKNKTREVIVAAEGGGLSVTFVNKEAEPEVMRDESGTMRNLVDSALALRDAAARYLAEEVVSEGVRRLRLVDVTPESDPSVLLHWKFEEE